ncbi:TPA: hypothetical protein ACRXYB_006252 [Pseudomonas aeruginosa]
MTNQKRITVQEIENQAAHRRQIELIFARACAESLKESARDILALGEGDREAAAKAHGEAFASAFVFVSRCFTSEDSAGSPSLAEPIPHSDPATAVQPPLWRLAESLEGLLRLLSAERESALPQSGR